MVRRRSTVRFRNGAHECKHEKRHSIRLEADRVAFSLFPAVYGPCRSPAGVCAQYVPKFLAVVVLTVFAGAAEGFLNAPFGDGVLPVWALGVDLEQDGRLLRRLPGGNGE
jgi:hypothetical protein